MPGWCWTFLLVNAVSLEAVQEQLSCMGLSDLKVWLWMVGGDLTRWRCGAESKIQTYFLFILQRSTKHKVRKYRRVHRSGSLDSIKVILVQAHAFSLLVHGFTGSSHFISPTREDRSIIPGREYISWRLLDCRDDSSKKSSRLVKSGQ